MNGGTPHIRIVLIDDHVLFREGLRRVIENDGSMRVVGEAATPQEAYDLFTKGPQFDIALIDYQLDTLHPAGGLETVRALRRSLPEAKALILTGALPREAFVEVVKLYGASVFLKSEPLASLRQTIERTLRGEVVISPAAKLAWSDLAERADAPAEVVFTDRERQVLRFITEGLSNKEIGSRLETSETNVKAVVQRVFWKTGVRSRSQLVRYVFEFNVDLN